MSPRLLLLALAALAAPLRAGETPDFAPPVKHVPGQGIVAFAVADLDGQHGPDVAVAASEVLLTILLHDGAGGFDAAQTLELDDGGLHLDVVAADLDGDGDRDLALVSFAQGAVVVLHNDGSGHFAAPVTFPAPGTSFTRGLVAEDLDGDGDLDLLTGDGFGTAKVALLNDGAGAFHEAATSSAGGTTIGLASGDLDGDGIPDAVSTFDQGTWLHTGVGDGAFTDTALLHAHHGTAVALGDMDGDADLDVVAVGVGEGAGELVLLRNTATGFVPETTAIDILVRNVNLADLDGDGDLDVVTGHVASVNEVNVLLNDGGGALSAPVGFTPGIYPQSVAVADMDADGAPDIVTGNQFDAPPSVSVLVNQCPSGLAAVSARNGSGLNPSAYTSDDAPVLGTTFTARVDASVLPGATGSVILFSGAPLAGLPTNLGELLVATPFLAISTLATPAPDGFTEHAFPVPNEPSLAGLVLPTQAALLGAGKQLTNALDLTLGP